MSTPSPIRSLLVALGLVLSGPAHALPNLEGCVTIEVAPDGSDVTYTAHVTNTGDAPAQKSFWWDAWFNSLEQPTQQSSWAELVPAGLGVGQVYEATTTWSQQYPSSPVPVGTLRAWMFVDSLYALGEADESDNWCGPVPYVLGDPDLPDLVVTSVEVDVNEDVVTVRAEITNQGPLDAGPFNVDVFLDRDAAPTPGMFGDDVLGVPDGLLAGSTLTVEFPPLALANGSYCSWLLLDTEDAVLEREEGNNAGGPHCFEVAATTSLDRPDLVITDFTSEVLDDQVLYTVWVKNAGTRSTGAGFSVGLFVDDALQPQTGSTPDVVMPVGELPRGAVQDVYLYWTDLSNGQFTSWAFADVDGDVPEIIEKNNTAGPLPLTVALAGPDLSVVDFTWTWDPLGAVVYQVEVKNVGSEAALPFDLDLALDLDQAPTPEGLQDAPVLSQHDDLGLAVDEARTYTLRWDEPTVGDHHSWVAVDLFRESGDRLLGNNVDGPLDVPVTAESLELPDVRVEALAAEPSGAALDLYVKVTNAGPRATGPFRVALFLSRLQAPHAGERGDLETTVPNLGPADAEGTGDEVIWTPAYTVLQDSTFSLWVLADSDDEVLESNELNNLGGPRGASVQVSACAVDELLAAECLCGADIARTGEFCCEGGVVSTLRCSAQQADWDEADGVVEGDGGGGGCSTARVHEKFPNGPLVIFVLALGLLTGGRRSRSRGTSWHPKPTSASRER